MLSAIVLLCAAAQAAAPASAASGTTTVVLVRHAEKADDGTKDPGLSPAGQERAAALVKAVEPLKLGVIIVSDTKRAKDTAAPVAQARGLTPVVVTVAGGAEAHVKGVVDAIRSAPPGSAALVVGHSNTLAPVIGALGGPQVATLCEKQFATMYVLEGAPVRLATKSYGAADPEGADSCGP